VASNEDVMQKVVSVQYVRWYWRGSDAKLQNGTNEGSLCLGKLLTSKGAGDEAVAPASDAAKPFRGIAAWRRQETRGMKRT
jgi:hypothetical protein